jgi:hypothetical protein
MARRAHTQGPLSSAVGPPLLSSVVVTHGARNTTAPGHRWMAYLLRSSRVTTEREQDFRRALLRPHHDSALRQG